MIIFLLTVWAVLMTARVIYLQVFADPGSAIFVCQSRNLQLAMVRLAESNGIKAKFRIDTPGAIQRALMSNGWIFNHVIDPTLLERMGNPKAAFAFVVSDVRLSAIHCIELLRKNGMSDVILLTNIDPGVPEGKLLGVRFREGQDRFCIIFRRHFLRMGEKFGQKPPAWDWQEVDQEIINEG